MAAFDDDDDENRTLEAAWNTIEALGVPDSPMRRVYFDLARIIAGEDATELVMASAAFLALNREMRELFTRKSPLQQQLEHMRVRKELAEIMGEAIREIPGEEFVLEPLPTSPAELAAELGYSDGGRAVRRVLRVRHPEQVRGAPWPPLSEAQVNYVRAHLPRRG